MHTLAIHQQNVLQVAPEHAKRASAQRVTRINLVVGKLPGLADENVQLYSNLMSKGSLAQGMRLTFEWRPVRLRCLTCGQAFPLQDDLTCPTCRTTDSDMVAEREFYMDSRAE